MKYYISLACLLVMSSLTAQQYIDTNNPREIKSLLNKDNDLNGFGGIDFKMTDIKEQRTMLLGGYGGVLVNRNYMLGVAAYGLITSPEFEGQLLDGTTKELNLHGGYAGMLIGGSILTKELIHLSIPVILGAGQLQVSDHNFFTAYSDNEFIINQSAFFVIEPGAQVEFNLTKTLRLALGASYRLVEGLNLNNVTNSDLIGWTGLVSVRFGRF